MIDFNNIPNLKPNLAYTVKTSKGTWYTIYTEEVLNKNIENGNINPNNDLLYLRRIS